MIVWQLQIVQGLGIQAGQIASNVGSVAGFEELVTDLIIAGFETNTVLE